MSSPWIQFVKKWAKDKGMSYKEAMSSCKSAYQKSKLKRGGMMANPEPDVQDKRQLLLDIAQILDNGMYPANMENHPAVQNAIEWLDDQLEAMNPDEFEEDGNSLAFINQLNDDVINNRITPQRYDVGRTRLLRLQNIVNANPQEG